MLFSSYRRGASRLDSVGVLKIVVSRDVTSLVVLYIPAGDAFQILWGPRIDGSCRGKPKVIIGAMLRSNNFEAQVMGSTGGKCKLPVPDIVASVRDGHDFLFLITRVYSKRRGLVGTVAGLANKLSFGSVSMHSVEEPTYV